MLRFLHVDDDTRDLELSQRELYQALGEVEVVPITSPDTLQGHLGAAIPDLVITDYQLQWSDGLTVLRRVRETWPSVPVIMFTGSGNEEIAVAAMKSGLDDYVVKSARGYGLLAMTAQRLLEGARSRRLVGELQLRLHGLLERLDLGVVRVRAPDLELLEVNSAFLDLLDAPSMESVRPGDLKLLFGPGEAADRVVELERPDGCRRWISVRLDRHGRSVEDPVWEGILEDVTERKKLEVELREQTDRLAQEGRNKDHFLSILSHELRNPLGAITNSLFLLNRPGVDPAISSQALEMLTRQVKHLRRLVDELLDLSRINREKVQLKREPTDLGESVRKAADVVRPMARERRQELTLHLPSSPMSATVDPVRIEQILTNLMTNAVHFTPAAGRIQVFLETAGIEVVLRVRDNGLGIPAEMLERIFDPFVKVEDSPERNLQWGLGIGLTLVKGLVEAHGGRVEARSAGKDLGSEFVIHLPR